MTATTATTARSYAPTRVIPHSVIDGALCRDVNPDLFFPPDQDLRGRPQWTPSPAIAICRRCPVIESCRKDALSVVGLHGVWGGLTEGQRDKIRAEGQP